MKNNPNLNLIKGTLVIGKSKGMLHTPNFEGTCSIYSNFRSTLNTPFFKASEDLGCLLLEYHNQELLRKLKRRDLNLADTPLVCNLLNTSIFDEKESGNKVTRVAPLSNCLINPFELTLDLEILSLKYDKKFKVTKIYTATDVVLGRTELNPSIRLKYGLVSKNYPICNRSSLNL